MSQEMVTKLQQLIAEQLPANTAGEMKKFIENAEIVAKDLKIAKETNVKLQERIEELEKKHADLKKEVKSFKDRELSILEQENTIKNKILEIEARERNLCVVLLDKELEMTKSSKNDLYCLIDKVFSLPTVTVTKNSSREIHVPADSYNSYHQSKHLNDCTTETTEVKKQ